MMTASQDAERLCHILAALNYRGQRFPIEPESFSSPNFNLVCDILDWFSCIISGDSNKIKRFVQHSGGYEEMDEAARVNYLTSIGQLFSLKLGLHLNLLSLYRADAGSCTELIKIGELVHEAARLVSSKNDAQFNLGTSEWLATTLTRAEEPLISTFSSINSLNEMNAPIQETENLSLELEALLGDEAGLNEESMKILSQSLDLELLEQALLNAEHDIMERTEALKESNRELRNDSEQLDERLSSKKQELQDTKERMNDVLLQAPAYLDRYEKLHDNYERVYTDYVSKFRNLMYLRSCIYSSSAFDYTEAVVGSVDGIGSTEVVLNEVEEVTERGVGEDVEEGGDVEDGQDIRPVRTVLALESDDRTAKLESSKPMSASWIVDEVGVGGLVGAGREEILARRELEELLNEFVGETEGLGERDGRP